jgi:hypothetical protein
MSDEQQEVEEQLPPYIIEGARSGRSKCKTCRKKIDMSILRIGILIEGPYGTGFMWHHLPCAARRQFDKVSEAYELEAWKEAKTPPDGVPPLADLEKLRDEAAERKEKRKELPYAEVSPSGRAKCKHCDETIEKGKLRVALGREVVFGQQMRMSPINVHTNCAAAELMAEDCGTEVEGFADALRANSGDLSSDLVNQALAEVGELPG